VIDESARWIIRLSVPPATHNNVDPGHLRNSQEFFRAATYSRNSAVHNALAAKIFEGEDLLLKDLVVFQLAGVVMPARNLPELDVQVLVRQGHAQLARVYRTSNGLDHTFRNGSSRFLFAMRVDKFAN
jgi:hypothetical protein